MTAPDTDLDLGRSAFHERRWSDALDCLARADSEGGLPPQDIELAASVAMLLGLNAQSVEYLAQSPRRIPDHGGHGQRGPLCRVAGACS